MRTWGSTPCSQQIAQADGGRIEVTSAAGKGSTFVVKLPLQPDVNTRPGTSDRGAAASDSSDRVQA